MSEKIIPGPVSDDRCIREAVCIHTQKIFDSCKSEDIASLILIIYSIPPQKSRRVTPAALSNSHTSGDYDLYRLQGLSLSLLS